MTSAAKKILDDALALTESERRHVAERLLDSVPHESPEGLEQAWNAEAIRRATMLEQGNVHALDGEESVRELEIKVHSIGKE